MVITIGPIVEIEECLQDSPKFRLEIHETVVTAYCMFEKQIFLQDLIFVSLASLGCWEKVG